MTSTKKTPEFVVRVGVAGVIFNKKGQVLFGKRSGPVHGSGTWQLPGGHLEMGEELLDCAVRETLEETGLEVRGIKVVTITNDSFSDEKHYITVFALCEMKDENAVPERKEPLKCDGWEWWDLDRYFALHIPSEDEQKDLKAKGIPFDNLFLPLINLRKQLGSVDEMRRQFQ